MLEGYTGWHGEGKTYCAIYHGIQWYLQVAARAAKDGRPQPELWSNAHLVGARQFRNFPELLSMMENAVSDHRRVLVIVDEAGVWLPSRFWNKMSEGILALLQQRRRVGGGIDMIWTAPSIEHVDKMLRDVTQVAHHCKRFGGTEYSHDGGTKPFAFRVRTFDPREVAKAKPKGRGGHWVPFSRDVARLYETGVVELVPESHDAHDAKPDVYTEHDRRLATTPQRTVILAQKPPKRFGRS